MQKQEELDWQGDNAAKDKLHRNELAFNDLIKKLMLLIGERLSELQKGDYHQHEIKPGESYPEQLS